MNTTEAARATMSINWFVKDSVISSRSLTGKGVCHAKWMLEEIAKGEMTDEKANRWLGYAQGVMVTQDAGTLKQMKEINSVHAP